MEWALGLALQAFRQRKWLLRYHLYGRADLAGILRPLWVRVEEFDGVAITEVACSQEE